MPGFTDYKLKYQIVADAAQAKSEIKSVDDRLKGIGGDIGSNFGSALGPIAAVTGGFTLLAGAVAAVGTAAVVTGAALFNGVRQASEFASTLFDASQKTGLSAAAISTLKFNAEAAGTTLEAVTSGAAKFSKVIIEAADGSEKAQKTLNALGVTSTNLDEALGQAFSTISKYPDGVQQMAAAQKAFGKSGADLIPLIKQMNGDLQGSIARAKELGIVFTEEDLKAADDFGDTLGFLGTQFQVLSSRILLQFAPALTKGMEAASEAVQSHSGQIENLIRNLGYAIKGVEIATTSSTAQMIYDWGAWGIKMFQIIDPVQHALNNLREQMVNAAITAGKNAPKEAFAGGSVSPLLGLLGSNPGATRTPRAGGGPRGKSADQLKAEAERAERERIQGIREGLQQEIELRSASIDVVRARTDADLQQGILSEEQALAIKQKLAADFLRFKVEKLNEELKAVQGNAKEEGRVLYELQIANLKVEEEIHKQRQESSEAYEKRLKRQVDLWQQMTDAMQAAHEELADMNRELGGQYEGVEGGTGTAPASNPFFDALFGGIGIDNMKSNAEQMKAILGDFGSFTADIFGQMADAVGQSIAAWALYGENIGTALRKATAAVLAQIAAQAAVKAIFQLAEGFAALAIGDARGAAMHFTAAAIYGAVAAGAAVAARVVAGDSFKNGGSGKSSGSSGSGSSSSSINQNPTPYTRASQDAYISGQRDPHAKFVADAIDRLNDTITKRLENARPGDVLMRGIDQRPGAIGAAAVNDIRRNSSTGTNLKRAMGDR